MGAPKQKWTQEEEAALKAGVRKHGAGKWRTILKDPEYSGILFLRSNVDLKDKWRNMSVIANGWGSREKARLALKRMRPVSKNEDNSLALTMVASDDEIMDPKPVAVSSSSSQIGVPKRSMIRLDNLIMEAINTLKEPTGSSKTTIGSYIEEKYWSPPNFERLLSAKLKFLASSGKLIKTKRRYRIAPPSILPDKRSTPSSLFIEGRPIRDSPNFEKDDYTAFAKAQIDLELAKMRSMTPEEAAIAAAQAVAEAEAAIAKAEEAEREAEAAEADAEAAQAFAEAAMKTLRGRNRLGTNMQTVCA